MARKKPAPTEEPEAQPEGIEPTATPPTDGMAPTDDLEPPPAPAPPQEEPAPAAKVRRACVFCNREMEVDLQDLEGARRIVEGSLGIDYFVCRECSDATTRAGT